VHGAPAAQLRVTVDDLLGREPVESTPTCARRAAGKSVLITGAAGFIASELARAAGLRPAVLHLLDTTNRAHDPQRATWCPMRRTRACAPALRCADADQTDGAFAQARPEIVFHAAAYKHIPVMEDFPEAALRVNVAGTLNVCAAAQRHDAAKVVFVSTDKAVSPDNVYGASKRIGELLATALGQEGRTVFAAVRFGNVMGSRGSVVRCSSDRSRAAAPCCSRTATRRASR
jgi:FlaA1/EpsC-like NDP-sugar epimerase